MLFFRILQKLKALTVCFLLLSCSQKTEKSIFQHPKTPWDQNLDKVDFSRCQNSPNDGDDFKINNLNIEKTKFLKKSYPLNNFNSALSASASSIVNFLHKTGVSVFKIKDSGECQFFGELNKAPSSLEEIWHNENAKIKTEKLKIMGLFFAEYSKVGKQSRIKQKAIMLRSTSNKWHLVHEALHFFFAEQRQKTEPFLFPDDLTEFLNQLNAKRTDLIKKIKESPKDQDLVNKWVNLTNEYFEHVVLRDSRTVLEEFVIEGMLIKASLSGDFLGVDVNSLTQGFLQFQNQYMRAKTIYTDFFKEIKDLKQNVELEEEKQFNKLLKRVEKFISDLDNEYLEIKNQVVN